MPRPVKYISVMLTAIASGTWGYLRYCSDCRPAAPGQAASAPDPAHSLNQEIPTFFR